MTLHEAILAVIEKNPEPMKTRDISQEINKYSLYKRKGDKPVSPNQIWARANKYKELFRITDEKKISVSSIKSSKLDDFLKLIRNFLVHNYSANSDILIPYLVLYIRLNEKNKFDDSFDNMRFSDLAISSTLEKDLLETIGKFRFKNLPNRFYITLVNSVELFDENVKNTILKIGSYHRLLTSLDDADFRLLFQKLISLVSGTKSRGFEFATPDVLANFLSQLIDLKPQQSIYDPFAGLCVLLSKVVAGKKDIMVSANDINDKVGTVGIMNLLINDIENFEYSFDDVFLNPINRKTYDWIVSNPPFVTPKNTISQNGYSFETPVSYIYNRLKTKGRALIIIPDSFLFSSDKKHRKLRKQLIEEKSIRAVVSLPNGIFQPFASNATSLLFIDKENLSEGVFFADFSNISTDEFEYKIETYASAIRRRKEITGISKFINYNEIIWDEYCNLLPRKNMLLQFADSNYSQGGILLKELIEKRITGYSVPSSNMNEEQDGIPYLRITDLPDESKIPYILSTPIKFVSDTEEMKAVRFIEDGNIAIAKVGNNLNPSIYNLTEPSLVSNNLFCFSVKKNIVLPEYLVKELKADYVKEQLEAIQIRATGPNYYKERDLLNLRILVPPLNEQTKNIGSSSRNVKDFMASFKEGLLDLFKEEDAKHIPEKKVNEEEIISSIKHRIAQYVSPISNDIQSLEVYFGRKKREGTLFTDSDRISGREDALHVGDVFNRVKINLRGIGGTFDLMKNILYFNKEDSKFASEDISSLIREAHDSVKDRLAGVTYNVSIDDNLQTQDLIVPADKVQIIELLRNFFINSVKHGFDKTIPKKVISIFVTKNTNNNFLEVNLINNGKPFPEGFTMEDFISFGRKGTDSEGTGTGGYLMKKIVDNHSGLLEWLGDENLRFSIEDESQESITSIATIHFKISLPYINT